jgi:hypothetical protein
MSVPWELSIMSEILNPKPYSWSANPNLNLLLSIYLSGFLPPLLSPAIAKPSWSLSLSLLWHPHGGEDAILTTIAKPSWSLSLLWHPHGGEDAILTTIAKPSWSLSLLRHPHGGERMQSSQVHQFLWFQILNSPEL